MTCFQQETTLVVREFREVTPGLYNVLGIPTTLEEMNARGWWIIPDPGYRGVPKASTEVLTGPGAGSCSSANNQLEKD